MDRLTPNKSLAAGGCLTSPNGQFRLCLQTDGNLVIYNAANQAIWSPNLAGRGGSRATMQLDGNFVVYTAAGAAVWDASTQGHRGALIRMQDDGNLVIYVGPTPIWQSYTDGGHYHPPSGGGVLSTLTHAVSSIPIVSTVVNAIASVPRMVDDIAHGARIDHAVLDHFKREIGNVRELAPYAQTVVSFVPGIGTGAAAAIAGGLALAQGQPVTAALMAAVRGALPGGPIAQAGFDLARGLVEGKSLQASALDAAIAQLPPAARPAAQIAAALAQAKNTQTGLVQIAVDQAQRAGINTALVSRVPGLAAAATTFHAAQASANLSASAAALKLGNATVAAAHAAVAQAHTLAHQSATAARVVHAQMTQAVAAQAAPAVLSHATTIVRAAELLHPTAQAYTRSLAGRPDPAAKVQLDLLAIARRALREQARVQHAGYAGGFSIT